MVLVSACLAWVGLVAELGADVIADVRFAEGWVDGAGEVWLLEGAVAFGGHGVDETLPVIEGVEDGSVGEMLVGTPCGGWYGAGSATLGVADVVETAAVERCLHGWSLLPVWCGYGW